jgi:hypothetical protein
MANRGTTNPEGVDGTNDWLSGFLGPLAVAGSSAGAPGALCMMDRAYA